VIAGAVSRGSGPKAAGQNAGGSILQYSECPQESRSILGISPGSLRLFVDTDLGIESPDRSDVKIPYMFTPQIPEYTL
jgi:hypothetical protein